MSLPDWDGVRDEVEEPTIEPSVLDDTAAAVSPPAVSPAGAAPSADSSAQNLMSSRPSEAALEMTGIRKVYNTGSVAFAALKGIDLSIQSGDFVAVTGPSGSGKSTLMNIVGCLDRPTSGVYRMEGEEVSTLSDNRLAEIRNRRIGFVFQSFNLLPRATALENVEVPLFYRGIPRRKRVPVARQILDRVGLAHRADHTPAQLSGGEQQRVAIARALVGDPTLILADEPTGNLDTARTVEILRLFEELHDEGRTILLITHEPEVASRAMRTIVMRDGELSG